MHGTPRPLQDIVWNDMEYDAAKHHRRSIRLPGHDYASPGAYFATLCVQGGECLLGEVVDGEMRLSEWGQIASDYWLRIPQHFDHVKLDGWVVMPNHLHGIIVIVSGGEASPRRSFSTDDLTSVGAEPQDKDIAGDASPLPSGSLGAIVGNYKSVSTRRINRLRGTPGLRFWQRNYWEHVIRDEQSLNRIREYIQNNPARWAEDQLHPDALPNAFNQWQPSEL